MTDNPGDFLLSKNFIERFHVTVQMFCAMACSDEKKVLPGINNLKTFSDAAELLMQAYEAGERTEGFGFGLSMGHRPDESGESLVELLQVHIGTQDGPFFTVEQAPDGMSVYASTFCVSSSPQRGNGMSRDTLAEFSSMPHPIKRVLTAALKAFPPVIIGDAAILLDALIRTIDYQPIETFYLEQQVAYNLLTALDMLDHFRGFDPEDDDSFAFRWSEYQVFATEPARGSFISEKLKSIDNNLEVEFVTDDTQNIIIEVILRYPMADEDRVLEICIDMFGVSVDMGFALFILDSDAVMEPSEAGWFFQNTAPDLRERCIRVIDGLHPFTKNNASAENERRRARRLLGSPLQEAS